MVQVLQAALAGIWFLALRLRTRSIYPAMLMHGLWDFAVFLVGQSGPAREATDVSTSPQLVLVAILILPVLAYGLWLLRGIGKQDKDAILA